jgi:hypothetical protein
MRGVCRTAVKAATVLIQQQKHTKAVADFIFQRLASQSVYTIRDAVGCLNIQYGDCSLSYTIVVYRQSSHCNECQRRKIGLTPIRDSIKVLSLVQLLYNPTLLILGMTGSDELEADRVRPSLLLASLPYFDAIKRNNSKRADWSKLDPFQTLYPAKRA